MRKLFLLPALLLVLEATPALSLSDSPYLARGAFDAVNLLPPPPEPNSAEQKRDVEAVLQAQRTSTPERMRLAQADARVDLSRFADVLGPNFVPDKMPVVVAFFRKVARDTGTVVTNRQGLLGTAAALPCRCPDPPAGPDAAGNRHRARDGGAEHRPA